MSFPFLVLFIFVIVAGIHFIHFTIMYGNNCYLSNTWKIPKKKNLTHIWKMGHVHIFIILDGVSALVDYVIALEFGRVRLSFCKIFMLFFNFFY